MTAKALRSPPPSLLHPIRLAPVHCEALICACFSQNIPNDCPLKHLCSYFFFSTQTILQNWLLISPPQRCFPFISGSSYLTNICLCLTSCLLSICLFSLSSKTKLPVIMVCVCSLISSVPRMINVWKILIAQVNRRNYTIIQDYIIMLLFTQPITICTNIERLVLYVLCISQIFPPLQRRSYILITRYLSPDYKILITGLSSLHIDTP